MSNYAWVCFDCRMAVRRPGQSKNVRCPTCARPCECLGHKTPIPPKSKVKDWTRLREGFYRFRRELVAKDFSLRMAKIHTLEQKIARLSRLSEKPGRVSMIKFLQRKLEAAHA